MKPILFAGILLLSLSGIAQKKFEKAFIVTNSSDTLRGYVDYVEQDRNPVDIRFKKNLEDNDFQTYRIHDVQYFEIEGYEYYSRWVCSISMDESEFSRLSNGVDSSKRTDTVFLRLLTAGKYVQLYSYKDKLKLRFYIKGKDDPAPQELIYRVSIDNEEGARVKEENIFQGQLIQYAIQNNAATDKLYALAGRSKYSQRELTKIAETINGGNEVTFEKANHYKKNRFFIEAGVNRSSFKFTGLDYLAAIKFSSSLTPAFSVGIDQFIKPAIGRVMLRGELSFYMDRLHGSNKRTNTWIDNYELKRNTVGISLSVLTNLYNSESFKFFIGLGGGLNFSKYPEVSYYVKYGESAPATEKYTQDFRSTSMPIIGRIGCVLNSRIELSLVYNGVVGRLTENYMTFSDKYSCQQIRVGYLFSNKKK
ncbi:outer membrane beta-barrel protein [Pinibacter aurantiacus]|uniref:Outer membrane protein beta-barrel domain-containing protein n=1 Tax=Pinibacter aurantiacus TaxID=2851599 RepID=A0A9E2SAX9_9BACT|nr:outer membrane beta-barrel protein [Pinibacter aurantiacus]MBV4357952.1 hypothetical protein [Pinibacter aurantiacus]